MSASVIQRLIGMPAQQYHSKEMTRLKSSVPRSFWPIAQRHGDEGGVKRDRLTLS